MQNLASKGIKRGSRVLNTELLLTSATHAGKEEHRGKGKNGLHDTHLFTVTVPLLAPASFAACENSTSDKLTRKRAR